MTHAQIASLHVYPVKGCGGQQVAVADVAANGLTVGGAGDREWMVVRRDGQFVTQREFPRLALVKTGLRGGMLELAVPDHQTVRVPLASAAGPVLDVVVWRSAVRGIDAGDAPAALLSEWLGTELRLVRFDRTLPRLCNTEFAGDSGATTMFADGYPVLIIGRASLDDLNTRLVADGSSALPMNRFRPSIVLDGLDPYAEDHLDTIEIDGVTLRCVKLCVRCQVTTTDQDNAQVGLEPLRTMGGYRMNERLGGVTFGVNAIPVHGAGRSIAQGATAELSYAF